MVVIYNPGHFHRLLKINDLANAPYEERYAFYIAMIESGFMVDSEIQESFERELLSRIEAGETEANETTQS